MKRIVERNARAALCGLVGLLAWSWPGPLSAAPGQIHEVKRPEVNLRAGPGTDTKVLRKLEAGARVMEFGRKGRWVRVQEMGRVGPEGWIRRDLIAPEVLPAPLPPEEAGRPPADDGQPGPAAEDGEGRTYYAYPRLGHRRHGLRNRAFLPWGVTVKRKRPHGKKDKAHGGKSGKGRVLRDQRPRGASRNLGGPRGGAANVGTF